jgi:hypothetical protein
MTLSKSLNGGRRNRTVRKRATKKRTTLRKNKKRTRSNRRRSNKGGFVGGIIEQALVPFGLFALQKKMHNRKLTKTSKLSKRKRR